MTQTPLSLILGWVGGGFCHPLRFKNAVLPDHKSNLSLLCKQHILHVWLFSLLGPKQFLSYLNSVGSQSGLNFCDFFFPSLLTSLSSCVVLTVCFLPFLSWSLMCLCCTLSLMSLFQWGWGWGQLFPWADGVRKPPGPWKVSDLDIVVDPVPPSLPESHPGSGASTGSDGTSRECTVLHKQKDGTCWTCLSIVAQDPQHALKFLLPS